MDKENTTADLTEKTFQDAIDFFDKLYDEKCAIKCSLGYEEKELIWRKRMKMTIKCLKFKGRPLFKSYYMGMGNWMYNWPRHLFEKMNNHYWAKQMKKGKFKYKTQYLNNPKEKRRKK